MAQRPDRSAVRFVLASASPRRRELLARVTSRFDVVTADIDETVSGTPEARVAKLARAKARAVAPHAPGIILGADTLVVIEGDVIGKPTDRADARSILERLSGRDHEVLTGLCVLDSATGDESVAVERTVVRFRPLQSWEIEEYLDSGEAGDKAGAYAIQGRAALFVEGIRGDYYNVMGLPLCRLYLMLREMGIHP